MVNRIKELDGIIDEIARRLKNPRVGISKQETTELCEAKASAMVQRIYWTLRRRFEK